MHKGPVTVIATEYGTRLDNQPVSRSATVDGVPDFVNPYKYDAEANRTRRTKVATGEVTEYHWDHRNRLVQVRTRTSDQGPVTSDISYAYDYLNRWIARSHDPDGDGPLGFTDTYFVYDGTPPSGSLLDPAAVTMENIGQIVLHFETDGQGDPQLAHRYLWGPAVDQILADEQVTDPTAPGNVVWPLTDHLNTVRDLAVYDADTDTTTIVNHLIYDAYGRITSQSDPDHTTLFTFTARPFDPATNLQNNLNRWYDAEVGRWMSEDPIGFEAADPNLYRYVDNMPTLYVDPTGLENIFSWLNWRHWRERWWRGPQLDREIQRRQLNAAQGSNDLADDFSRIRFSGAKEAAADVSMLLDLNSTASGIIAGSASVRGIAPKGVPTNLGPFGSKAPKQISPGPRVLQGHYIDDLGRSQPWRAHYDEYGRLIGRTDFNAGNRAAGIPDIHHHIYEYTPEFPLGRQIGSHIPGEFLP